MEKFRYIAGYSEEKKLLQNISSLFKNPEKLKEIGADFPKGLLLTGPNGLGKTKFAEAFIQNAGIRSVTINPNDIEIDTDYKSYLDSKFKEATESLPCILYFDELDKFIGVRDQMFSDEVNNKSRFLLNEINKYSKKEGLFLLFVTNDKHVIDGSLIRSGRIDTVLTLDYPNKEERHEITKMYLKKTNYDHNINIEEVANLFSGLSCADIKNVINNAAIHALLNKGDMVTYKDICSSMLDKVFNTSGKLISKEREELNRLATHEAGHVALYMLVKNEVPNIASILSRKKALGYVLRGKDKGIMTLEDINNEAKILLGGFAAERILLNGSSLGCRDDITSTKQLITDLVRRDCYGDSSLLETIDGESYENAPFQMSESKLESVEAEENLLMKYALRDAERLINDNRTLVDTIKEKLITDKILFKSDLEELYKVYFRTDAF